MLESTLVGLHLSARYHLDNNYMVEAARPNREVHIYGMKFFNGVNSVHQTPFSSNSVSVDGLRYDTRTWRPEETVNAAKLLETHNRIVVAGGPQSGKGTLIYGLSSICDKQGIGYLMIDGHWQEAPANDVIEAIKRAEDEGKVIFYDSFDYLFAKTSKLRKLPITKHAERTDQILSALAKTTVPLVMTSHEGYWEKLFLNQEMIAKHHDFLETAGKYELSRYIESEDSRAIFLIDHGYKPHEVAQLVNFPDNPILLDVCTKILGNKDYKDEVELALKDYGVLKVLAREVNIDVLDLLKKIEQNDLEAAKDLIYLILYIHFESDFGASLRFDSKKK